MKSLILLLSLIMLMSCSVVKKSSAVTKSVTDSSSLIHKDSVNVFKIDSTGTRKENGDFEKTTVYLYDTVYRFIRIPGEPGQTDTVIQYVPRLVKVFEKGRYATEETARKISSDSGHLVNSDSSSFKKAVSIETKTKQASRIPWWLVIVAVVTVLAGAVVWYERNLK